MRLSKVLTICGACIAFAIGAGMATMQELMQYEVSYGSSFWIVILIVAAIYLYTNVSFAFNGNRRGLSRGSDIFTVYCGKVIGRFFDWFSVALCYMSYIVMCGGTNSIAMQQWGMPNGVGALALALCVILTVVFGLDGIVRLFGKLGPVIIVVLVIVAIVSIATSSAGFSESVAKIDNGTYALVQIGNGNPFASGASYGGFGLLWFAVFLAEIGAKNKLENVNAGVVLSAFFVFGMVALCCIALILNIDSVWNVDIPALVLAESISPLLGLLLSIIIFLGIFTSATPLLWTGVRRVSEDGTVRSRIVTVVAGAIGCAIACFVPFAPLLNIIYGMNGYLGFVLLAFMVVNDVKLFVRRRAN